MKKYICNRCQKDIPEDSLAKWRLEPTKSPDRYWENFSVSLHLELCEKCKKLFDEKFSKLMNEFGISLRIKKYGE